MRLSDRHGDSALALDLDIALTEVRERLDAFDARLRKIEGRSVEPEQPGSESAPATAVEGAAEGNAEDAPPT